MSTESQVFGKRAQKHIIILASGDKVRHMTFQPWMAALSVCAISVFSIGYLAATSYLVLRDDLIGGTMARQARMQHEYEDRIAALRAQVDRVTSRQLLDQQVVEDKVEKLLQQQMALSSRHGRLGSLLDRAEESGIAEKDVQPSETTPLSYEKRADASSGVKAIERLMGMAGKPPQQKVALAYAPQSAPGGQEAMSDRADRLFSKVTLSLKDIEQEQKSRIDSLTAGASEATDAIMTILARTGVKVAADEVAATAPVPGDDDAIGGPFVEPETTEAFDNSLVGLDTALARLESVRSQAKKLPFNNPSPASDITSSFGNRLDPFPWPAGAACRYRFSCTDRNADSRNGTRHGDHRRQDWRLWQHGRNRPRQRHHHPLRASIDHSGQCWRQDYHWRSHCPLRQHGPLHRSASALRSPLEWRGGRSDAVPDGRH